MIRIDADLVEKAKEMDLNISKVCENILIQAVKTLEQVFIENKGGNLETVGSGWCGELGRWDFVTILLVN